jgi:cytochrome c-type biogenesis protein CcmH
MKKLVFVILSLFIFWSSVTGAVEPSEMLDDPVLEQRAREISKGLRCLVCQNQSIDDSNAGLARDLRILVRERLTAGDSDQEVIDYIVFRYGDFVLLKPPFKIATLALWLGPLGIAGAAGLVYFNFFRRRSTDIKVVPSLSQEEEDRFEKIIEET